MGISFEQSGHGLIHFGLAEVSELALQHGFVKKDVEANAPLAARADLAAFFKAYDCNALSSFRKRFCEQPLEPVSASAPKAATAVAAQGLELERPVACTPEPLERYPELAAKFDSLPWRLTRRPGAANIKPEDYHRLYAASQQAEHGDNTEARPIWSANGSLDYQGQERHDAWAKAKGMSRDDAIAAFCRIFAEAHTPERAKVNFYSRG